MKAARRLLLVLLVLYGGWCAALYRMQTELFFPGAFFGPEAQPSLPAGAELSAIRHPDGVHTELVLMMTPPTGDRPAPLLVYLHGNGAIAGGSARALRHWAARGVSVAVPEYRGYGASGGEPSEASVGADLVRIIDQLTARPDVDAARLVYYGRSVGTGFAAQLAYARPPAAMVLQTPFLRTDIMAHDYGAPAFLVKNPFRTDLVAGSFDFPVLLLQHSLDQLAPPSDADALHTLLPDSRLVSVPTDHNGPQEPRHLAIQRAAIAALLSTLAESGHPEPTRD